MPVGGSMLLPFQIFVPDTLGDLGPISVDERFSTLVSTLMPQYVQNDHQKFVTFIKVAVQCSPTLLPFTRTKFGATPNPCAIVPALPVPV